MRLQRGPNLLTAQSQRDASTFAVELDDSMFGIDTEDSDLSLVSDRESSNSPPHPSPIRARDVPQSETGAQAAVGAGSASTIMHHA